MIYTNEKSALTILIQPGSKEKHFSFSLRPELLEIISEINPTISRAEINNLFVEKFSSLLSNHIVVQIKDNNFSNSVIKFQVILKSIACDLPEDGVVYNIIETVLKQIVDSASSYLDKKNNPIKCYPPFF